jgi:hypothetical protein
MHIIRSALVPLLSLENDSQAASKGWPCAMIRPPGLAISAVLDCSNILNNVGRCGSRLIGSIAGPRSRAFVR